MAKLTVTQQHEILARSVEGESNVVLAKSYGVSEGYIRKIRKANPISTIVYERKKTECVQNMEAYLESRTEKAQRIIDIGLDELESKERFEKARLPEITTAVGTLIDKFTKTPGALQAAGPARESVAALTTEELKALAAEYQKRDTR